MSVGYSSTDTTPVNSTQRIFLGSYTFLRAHSQKGPGMMWSQRALAGGSIQAAAVWLLMPKVRILFHCKEGSPIERI